MTQEDKELLLKDLCARWPYGVKISKVIKNTENGTYISEPHLIKAFHDDCVTIEDEPFEDGLPDIDAWPLDEIKPYLRPMSSMTEEEWKEYRDINCCLTKDCNAWDEVDWLNSHHFDYRGLIEKGLALEAPKGMYNL